MTLHRAFFLAGAFALFPAAAQAKTPCSDIETMIEALQRDHHETIAWQGKAPTEQGVLDLILFQSTVGDTWSLVQVHGISACLVASGRVVTGRDA